MKENRELRRGTWLHGVALCAVVSLLAGCGNEHEPGGTPDTDGRVPLRVNSGIDVQTRAHDDTWDAGDAVGIYMLNGTTVEAENRKYTTSATGTQGSFTAADGQTIYFPTDGSQRDFTAYYPYRTPLTGNLFAVNVNNQAVQKDIDLMGAAKVTGKTKNDPAVSFEFQHKLVKLHLTLKPDGTSLTAADMKGLTVSVTNQKTRATYDVITGGSVTVDAEENTPATVELLTAADGTSSEGIVLPTETTETMQFVFRLKNATVFTWDIHNAEKSPLFRADNKYVYTITMGKTGIEVTSSVKDWTPGNGDDGETGSAE